MHIVIHMFRSMNMLEEIKAKWDEILLNIKEEHDISEVSYMAAAADPGFCG